MKIAPTPSGEFGISDGNWCQLTTKGNWIDTRTKEAFRPADDKLLIFETREAAVAFLRSLAPTPPTIPCEACNGQGKVKCRCCNGAGTLRSLVEGPEGELSHASFDGPYRKRDAMKPNDLTFREFSRVNRHRCESPSGFNHALGSWSLSDWMTATTGEVGEAANIVKKLNRVRDGIPGNTDTPEQLRQNLADELADVFIYLDLMAQAAGIDLPAAVLAKFDKTSTKVGYGGRLGKNAAGEYVKPGPYEHVDRDGRIRPDRDSIT